MDQRAFERMARAGELAYEVTLAKTLGEARAQLAANDFEVIVTDFHLPDGQGTELFDEVPETPFVLLTGTLEEQLALRTLERGADDYLAKTVDMLHLKVLPHTIEKTLHRQNLREAERRLSAALRDREEAMRASNEQLRVTNEKLEIFNRALVGRELRMIELKREINGLCAQLGQTPRYDLGFLKEESGQAR